MTLHSCFSNVMMLSDTKSSLCNVEFCRNYVRTFLQLSGQKMMLVVQRISTSFPMGGNRARFLVHAAGPSNIIVPYYVSAKQLQITSSIDYYGHSPPEGRGTPINRKEHRAIINLQLLGLFELEGFRWLDIYLFYYAR
jgi:hypothetical protein